MLESLSVRVAAEQVAERRRSVLCAHSLTPLLNTRSTRRAAQVHTRTTRRIEARASVTGRKRGSGGQETGEERGRGQQVSVPQSLAEWRRDTLDLTRAVAVAVDRSRSRSRSGPRIGFGARVV